MYWYIIIDSIAYSKNKKIKLTTAWYYNNLIQKIPLFDFELDFFWLKFMI